MAEELRCMIPISQFNRIERIRETMHDRQNVIIQHMGGKHRFHSIFVRDGGNRRNIQNVIKLIFGEVPKDMVYDDAEGIQFIGNRLAKDMEAMKPMFHHVATFCTDILDDGERGDYITPNTQRFTIPTVRKMPRENEVTIDMDESRELGLAIVTKLISDLISNCKFEKHIESQLIPVDDFGNIVAQKNIVCCPSGEFITHGTCQCGETLGCRYFTLLEDAITYRDHRGPECWNCFVKECERTGLCEHCEHDNEGTCPLCDTEDEDKGYGTEKPCPEFVFYENMFNDCDGSDNECSCPLR